MIADPFSLAPVSLPQVINSCTNLEELGMPSAIVAYNAKVQCVLSPI